MALTVEQIAAAAPHAPAHIVAAIVANASAVFAVTLPQDISHDA
jgi:hypothetical protein